MTRPIRSALTALVLGGWVFASGARAETFVLDAEPSRLDFELGATLHTVRGSIRLSEGALVFDPTTGAASGVLVADATSAETGNGTRDRQMHERVLASANHPEIRLRATHVEFDAPWEYGLPRSGVLRGEVDLRGDSHAIEVPFALVPIESAAGAPRAQATGRFAVPYVAWGLPDVSNLVLRVAPVVTLSFLVEGVLRADDPAPVATAP